MVGGLKRSEMYALKTRKKKQIQRTYVARQDVLVKRRKHLKESKIVGGVALTGYPLSIHFDSNNS